MISRRLAFWLPLAIALAVHPSFAGQRYASAIFDAHLHYNEAEWPLLSPRQVERLLDQAGVSRAAVSSTPESGAMRLARLWPDRFVPLLRPYRDHADKYLWLLGSGVTGGLSERIEGSSYAGIGEIHIFWGWETLSPLSTRVVGLAHDKGLLLHIHGHASTIEQVMSLDPRARVLWAHAGFEDPHTVTAMLDRYPTLSADLSHRDDDIAPGGVLDEAWRQAILTHADRFMVGSDTAVPGRWARYSEIIDGIRGWLGQLPADVARGLAFDNAARFVFVQPKPGPAIEPGTGSVQRQSDQPFRAPDSSLVKPAMPGAG